MSRKILITGGAGFIGSALTTQLIKNPDNEVVVIDNLSTGSMHNLPDPPPSNLEIIKGDVNKYHDIAKVMGSHQFDFIFHYAAVVGVNRTLNNPIAVLRDINGIKYILQLARKTGVKRVFYASSSEVYGEPVEFPQNETTTPLNSKLPYAVVKNAGEAYLRSYHQEFGLNYTIFRFFNTYGPHQSTDFVMAKFIEQALHDQPITIYGDGNQTRTFCYISDNIDASLKALNKQKVKNDVINIGNDREIKIKALAQKIIDLTNSNSTIQHTDPLEEGDMQRRHPDITKMKKLLNRPLIPIEEGIKKSVQLKKRTKA